MTVSHFQHFFASFSLQSFNISFISTGKLIFGLGTEDLWLIMYAGRKQRTVRVKKTSSIKQTHRTTAALSNEKGHVGSLVHKRATHGSLE